MNVIQEPLYQLKRNKPSTSRVMTSKPAIVGRSVLGPPSTQKFTTAHSSFSTLATDQKRETSSSERMRSTTSKSTSSRQVNKSHVILAISEGRGQSRGVVGIASMDIQKPILILSQISDTQTYINTLTKVNILHPVEVLIPSTFIENTIQSHLFTVLKEQFPNLTVTSIPRCEFNRNQGFNYVTELCASVFSAVPLVIRHKFYALAAACALLKYIEKIKHIVYTSKSIKVDYQEPENTAIIDIDTCDRLELVACSRSDVKNSSLFAILDHCETSIGRRVLRTTILQPPCVQHVIEERLDCVQELLETPELMTKLKCVLANLNQIASILTFGTMVPLAAASVSERQLNYTLHLKSMLSGIEPLTVELANARHPVFRTIYARLVQSPCGDIQKLIGKVVQDDAHPATGRAGEMQRCFAIKNGLNGFLDIARKTYTEVIDDMQAHVTDLSTVYNLPLRVQHSVNKGFHIVLTLSKGLRQLKTTELPEIFIQAVRHSNAISMTTMNMINFGIRLKSNSQEIQKISNLIIYQMLIDIKPYIGHFYQLCDDVAFLDMLCSLAIASTTPGYIRPQFAQFMQLEDAKHPLLEYMCISHPISNPIFASQDYNMHVITGPNMSGKSVYIREVCLIQIMAQIGCYVPARSATVRVCSHVYARIGADDNFECNASSFMLEMKEMQYVFNTITDSSLVVMDELCRTTSCDEGASIAFAICERLLSYKAFSFIATHFQLLTRLADLYPNVTNWHLETMEVTRTNNITTALRFTHKLQKGVTNIDSYGIKLSRICGGSKLVSDRAEQLLASMIPLRKTLTAGDLKLIQLKEKIVNYSSNDSKSATKTNNIQTNINSFDIIDDNTYLPIDELLSIEMSVQSKNITFDSIPTQAEQSRDQFDNNNISIDSTLSSYSTTDPVGVILKTKLLPTYFNTFQNDSQSKTSTDVPLTQSFFDTKQNEPSSNIKIVSDMYDDSYEDNSLNETIIIQNNTLIVPVPGDRNDSLIASVDDEMIFIRDLNNLGGKTSTPKPSIVANLVSNHINSRSSGQYISNSSESLFKTQSITSNDTFRSPIHTATPTNEQKLDLCLSRESSYRTCENTSSDERYQVRSASIDDFIVNVNKRAAPYENLDANIQMCASKTELAKMRRIAAGNRDQQQPKLQMDFNAIRGKSKHPVDNILQRLFGKSMK